MSDIAEGNVRISLRKFMEIYVGSRVPSPVYASELAQRPLQIFDQFSAEVPLSRFREILKEVCNQVTFDCYKRNVS